MKFKVVPKHLDSPHELIVAFATFVKHRFKVKAEVWSDPKKRFHHILKISGKKKRKRKATKFLLWNMSDCERLPPKK